MKSINKSIKHDRLSHGVIYVIFGFIALFSARFQAYGVSPNAARLFGSAVADAVERVMPSVVVIRTQETRYKLAQGFFAVYSVPEKLVGQGSGFIFKKEGYVLTNNHVVDSADEIEVVLDDETVYPAQIVGRDYKTDLAVLKIEAEKGKTFSAIEFADSDKLRAGEFVVAIGSPFSLNSSVTLGTVSHTKRTFRTVSFVDFIQTDAAINQGNSGGPLIDVDGRMVGINTFIQTAGPYSEGSIGLGFAVPANLALRIGESIAQKGSAEFSWIGISMRNVREGVAVERVYEKSPAETGGLQIGDIIIEVAGIDTQYHRHVRNIVLSHPVGKEIEIKVVRQSREHKLSIKTEPLPDFLSSSQ